MNRNSIGILVLALGIALGLGTASALGGTLNLADQNSAIAITPTSSAGLTNWTVNGQNNATQQWFWYSIGNGAQASIDTLTLTGSGTYFNVGGGTRGGYVTYSGSNGLNVEVVSLLTGGLTNGQSDLAQTIRLTNTGTATQALHFFQYSNFNLSQGTSDTVQFPNANTVNQTGGTLAFQAVFTPTPSAYEALPYSQTLTGLTSGHYTLQDTPALGVNRGPGNVTWAYEWDPVLAPGATYIISSDQQLNPAVTVPEPWTPSLLFSAGLALMSGWGWRRWRAAP
jgi:hypothetical protein